MIDDIIKNCGKKQQQQQLQQQQGIRTSNGGGNFLGFGNRQAESKGFMSTGRFESNKFKNAIRESTNHDNFMKEVGQNQIQNEGNGEDGGSMMCLNRDGKKVS